MELQDSPFTAYAYTVKTRFKSDEDYEPFFNNLSKYVSKIEYKISERDSRSKLHYHGICYLPKDLFRKKLMVKGYSVKLVEIYNKEGWKKYIHKDCTFINMPESPEHNNCESPTLRVMPHKRLF